MRVLYFAWLRERIGLGEEFIADPPENVSSLIDQLCAKSEAYGAAFSERAVIRVALDQKLSDQNASLKGVSEVAFFPPMTGG